MKIKIFGGELYFYSPFRKSGNGDERLVGFKWYKDWHHDIEWDIRFSLFKMPHITRCKAYTVDKKNVYIVDFVTLASHSYRNRYGGFSAYHHYRDIRGIDEGREGSC